MKEYILISPKPNFLSPNMINKDRIFFVCVVRELGLLLLSGHSYFLQVSGVKRNWVFKDACRMETQNAFGQTCKHALGPVHLFIIKHLQKVARVCPQFTHLFNGKKLTVGHASHELWIKAAAEVLAAGGGIIMQKGRTWNSLHLIFDYDPLLKRTKSFPAEGRARFRWRVITSNASPVSIPLQMKGGVGVRRARRKWWRAGWLKRSEDEKCYLKWLSALAPMNPPVRAFLPWQTLTPETKNTHACAGKTGRRDWCHEPTKIILRTHL